MGKLQAAYWLLVVAPWVVLLVARSALRIWEKNLRPHLNEEDQPNSPVPPSVPLDRWGSQAADAGAKQRENRRTLGVTSGSQLSHKLP